MKDLLDKISSYNIFNYLLPGILFVVVLDKIASLRLIQDDIIIAAFVYYFVGLVISRFGSLVIEPLLKKISFVKFASYTDFVAASQKDAKLEVLSEVNNMYRTLLSMLVLLLVAFAYRFLELKWPGLGVWSPYILIVLLFVLFLFSYRKQTEYVAKRVKADTDE